MLQTTVIQQPDATNPTAWITAITALVAVIVGPLLTMWQIRANQRTTAQQLESASDLMSRQLEAAAESTARQVESASNLMNRQFEAAALSTTQQLESSRRAASRQIYTAVVSANRQNWINAVRDTIAEILSLVSSLSHDLDEGRLDNSVRGPKLERLALHLTKLELFLNPAESDNRELIATLREMNNWAVGPDLIDVGTFRSKRDAATNLATRILKREWDRIRREAEELDRATAV